MNPVRSLGQKNFIKIFLYSKTNEVQLSITNSGTGNSLSITSGTVPFVITSSNGEANQDYLIDMFLFLENTGTNNAGFVFNFGLPSGATYNSLIIHSSTATNNSVNGSSQAANETIGIGDDFGMMMIKGVIKIGSTAGQVTFRWTADSGTPSPATITVYEGSILNYKKL